MIARLCSAIVLAVILVVLQTSLLPVVAATVFISLPLAACIAFVANGKLVWACTVAGAAGFFLDCYSPMPFGTHLLALAVVVVVLHGIQEHFLTNRSSPVFILLALAGTALYDTLTVGATTVLTLLRITHYAQPLTYDLLWQLPTTALVVVLMMRIGMLLYRFGGRFFYIRTTSRFTP